MLPCGYLLVVFVSIALVCEGETRRAFLVVTSGGLFPFRGKTSERQKPADNESAQQLSSLHAVIDELRLEISSLKRQLLFSKENRNTWIKEKAQLQRDFASKLETLEQALVTQRQSINDELSQEYEAEAAQIIQQLQDDFEVEKAELESRLRLEFNAEIQSFKKQLAEAKLSESDAKQAIQELRQELKASREEVAEQSISLEVKERDFKQV